jgi:hypothetical protein
VAALEPVGVRYRPEADLFLSAERRSRIRLFLLKNKIKISKEIFFKSESKLISLSRIIEFRKLRQTYMARPEYSVIITSCLEECTLGIADKTGHGSDCYV